MRKILPSVLFVVFFGLAPVVEASCSVSVDPNNVVMGQSSVTHFNVRNDGEAMGNWVRIQANDQSAYTIANMQASGWYPNGGGAVANFAGGYLESGTSSEFNLTFAETGEVISSMNWEALLSYDGGENFESCGSATIQVIPAPAPPQISGVSITVGNASAVIKFETSLTAEGNVLYGVSGEYGGRVSDSASTSHVITLANLASSMTYHYQIQATSEGGTTSTTDAIFTTSAANVNTTITNTVTSTITNTVTSTVTNVNTVKQIVLDTTPPVLKLNSLEGSGVTPKRDRKVAVYEVAPLISGNVVDDRGIARVEYRIFERETSWSEANLDATVGAKKTNWDFLPPVSLDGSYRVEVRAVDVFGNVSSAKTIDFVIDQLLPTVVGGVISYGALPLEARQGMVRVVGGLEYEIVIYESGGADNVELSLLDKKWALKKTESSGLWRGTMTMPNLENLETKWLEVEASDGAGNVSVASWIEVMIIPAGRVLQNGQPVELDQLKIYQLDPTTKIYRVWDQAEYWPVSTEKSNLLNFILPAGTYYIESVPKTGNSKAKNRVVSQKISFEKSSNLLASDWELGESRSWLGWFGMRRLVPINIELDESKTGDMPSPISEREKWIGKKSVVFLRLADLPWYDQELYQAKVWAESEHAQLVISKVDIRIENGLLSKTYLIDSKGDTIDYKEGNWKR